MYFDHSATSYPKPDCVKQAVYESLDLYGNAGRGSYPLSLRAGRLLYQTRELCKEFFHAPVNSSVVFTSGATESLNIVIQGLFHRGDHIVTTRMEHNAVLRPLYEMERRGISLSYLNVNELGIIDPHLEEELIQKQPKAVICTHASNVTGNITDLKTLSRICHQHAILLIIDAAQTAGHYPIDMEEDGIDILCFSGHKGLLGPAGCGGIIMRKDYGIHPLLYGGSGFDSYSHKQPENLPERLEAGTLPISAIAGMQAGIRYIQQIGIEEIYRKEYHLASLFYEGIKDLSGIQFAGDMEAKDRCAIVSFTLESLDSAELTDILINEYDIAVRGGAHCAPLVHRHFHTEESGLTRFSFGYDQSEEEVLRAITAVRDITQVSL